MTDEKKHDAVQSSEPVHEKKSFNGADKLIPESFQGADKLRPTPPAKPAETPKVDDPKKQK